MNESFFEKHEKGDLRKDVVEALKNNNPNARELLVTWRKEREKEIILLNSASAEIRLSVESADICVEAGLFDEAWELLSSARIQANNENEVDLFLEIEKKMDELENSSF